jgi:SAM-dependent methyltransferase
MKANYINNLICPNYSDNLELYAISLKNNGSITSLFSTDLQPNDEVYEGILFNREENIVYPIIKSIPSLLSINEYEISVFDNILNYKIKLPDYIREAISNTIELISNSKPTEESKWIKEQMNYYLKSTTSDQQVSHMIQDIIKRPLWEIFLERKREIFDFINFKTIKKVILEIGCGNARTVYWMLNTANFQFDYFGVDTAFNRLVVAKTLIPEGNFFHASALNLPFKNTLFDAVISFGTIHHLPDQLKCFENIDAKLKKDGLICLHEPLEKPTILKKNSRLSRIFSEYEHSEHDNKFEFKKMIKFSGIQNYETINLKFKGSIFKTITYIIISPIKKYLIKHIWFVKSILFLDSVFLPILGSISKKMGPKVIFMVIRKQN